MRTRNEKILLCAGLFCAVVAAVLPLLVTPSFREVFQASGIALPLITRILLDYSAVLWVLPALVLLAWIYWPKPGHRALVACLTGAIALAIAVPTVIAAMYLPAFQLGTAS